MALFELTEDSPLPAAEAWARVTDWSRHDEKVPLTTIRVTTAPPNGVGTVFVAHTGVGPIGFDDPMEVVEWRPPEDGQPGRCRLQKRGTVMTGWAELHVDPATSGSRVMWREDIHVWRLPRLADRPTVIASKLLFRRVLRHLLGSAAA